MPAVLAPPALPIAAPPIANGAVPMPGGSDEAARFEALQASFRDQYKRVFPDRLAARTVVVVPSLTLPPEELAKIDGAHHYEERMLFTLMLLRMPHTRLVYVTSQPIAPGIVDYYLH
ncbi:MAG: hypothetical protein AAF594_18095, partial [Bacteroidota bacterium]